MEQISVEESSSLMRSYGIPLPKTVVVKSKAEAIKAVRNLGFPVVMKVLSSKILHKSDVGGVKLNIRSESEAERAYDEIIKIKDAEGVIVQKFYEGHWVIVGMKRDPQFGPVIAFGLGGVLVEIMRDVVLRIAPVSIKEANEMIHEIKGASILKGARGGVRGDLGKVASVIVKLSKLALENKQIKEIDLNPLVVDEKGAVAVDVRILK
ncbi:MAG: acetate--CoA ligase family protein [Candidatus Woesearchaeota archaeon]